MNFFLFIFFFLFPSLVIGSDNNIYYCSETKSVGFFQSKNNKFSNVKEERFRVLIDFNNNFIKSESLFFGPYDKSKCFSHLSDGMKFLNCTNEWGISFVINQNTLDFKKSILPTNNKDSLILSYGQCERF